MATLPTAHTKQEGGWKLVPSLPGPRPTRTHPVLILSGPSQCRNPDCGHHSSVQFCESFQAITRAEGGLRDPSTAGRAVTRTHPHSQAHAPQGGTAAPCGNGSTGSCPRCHTWRARPIHRRASHWGTVWTWGQGSVTGGPRDIRPHAPIPGGPRAHLYWNLRGSRRLSLPLW